MKSLQETSTQYIKTQHSVVFAYRRLGSAQGVPLVMHIHFRANMDFWDPVLVNSLAAVRAVIIFDQAGVGRSTGTVPTSFYGWADDLIAFVEALDLHTIDLFGFSLGGVAVQLAALKKPQLIRNLILAGTTASKPLSKIPLIVWPRQLAPSEPFRRLANAVSVQEGKEAIFYSFFPHTIEGEDAAQAYWHRINTRQVESPNLVLLDKDEGGRNQKVAAFNRDWSDEESWFHKLTELKMPVLIANGDDDLLIPTSRSWELLTQIDNAQLVIYPKAGHGFLWQYAKEFARDIKDFLDWQQTKTFQPKL